MFIRDATEADLPRIVAIYNAAIPSRMATADTEPISVESRREWFHKFSPNRRPIWVMDSDESIIGWLCFNDFYEGRPAYHVTAEVSVYVAPEHQRQGIGKALLGEAIHRAPALGFKTLLCYIFGHNEPSLRLCNQFGFTQWGHLPRIAELDGEERDLVIYGLRLDSCYNVLRRMEGEPG